MNNKFFNKYKELLSERLDKIELLDISEDSIRYDFFVALSEIEKLEPSDIKLEYKFDENTFIPRNNNKSKRKEKPVLDLVVDTDKIKINVEFALFRQNSNKNGQINKTERTVKMLNDMIRLGLSSYYSKPKKDAYFICVADKKMLGHQLRRTKKIGKFPSDYIITKDLIQNQLSIKKDNFDERFTGVLYRENIQINSNIVFNEEILAKKINMETRVIVWKITYNKMI